MTPEEGKENVDVSSAPEEEEEAANDHDEDGGGDHGAKPRARASSSPTTRRSPRKRGNNADGASETMPVPSIEEEKADSSSDESEPPEEEEESNEDTEEVMKDEEKKKSPNRKRGISESDDDDDEDDDDESEAKKPAPVDSSIKKKGKKLSEESERDVKEAPSPTAVSPSKAVRPVKRARSAYFIFLDDKRGQVQKEHPGESVATAARLLGQLWSAMSDEDKKPYQEKAAAERERVAADLEAWKKIHGDALPDRQGTGLNRGSLVIPTARIRKICKLDPEVSGLSREAVLLVTAAAELATAALGRECVSVAQIQNRRKLLPEDVAHVCSTRERFLFLREDIQDIARKSQQEQKEAAAARKTKGKQSNTAAAAGTKPLTSYFASK